MFSEDQKDVNYEERAGRTSTSTTHKNIDEVKKIELANRRITVREVAEDLNISIGLCRSIFTINLAMRRVAAKFAQKLLNSTKNSIILRLVRSCWTLLDSVRKDPNLLQRVITGDES